MMASTVDRYLTDLIARIDKGQEFDAQDLRKITIMCRSLIRELAGATVDGDYNDD